MVLAMLRVVGAAELPKGGLLRTEQPQTERLSRQVSASGDTEAFLPAYPEVEDELTSSSEYGNSPKKGGSSPSAIGMPHAVIVNMTAEDHHDADEKVKTKMSPPPRMLMAALSKLKPRLVLARKRMLRVNRGMRKAYAKLKEALRKRHFFQKVIEKHYKKFKAAHHVILTGHVNDTKSKIGKYLQKFEDDIEDQKGEIDGEVNKTYDHISEMIAVLHNATLNSSKRANQEIEKVKQEMEDVEHLDQSWRRQVDRAIKRINTTAWKANLSAHLLTQDMGHAWMNVLREVEAFGHGGYTTNAEVNTIEEAMRDTVVALTFDLVHNQELVSGGFRSDLLGRNLKKLMTSLMSRHDQIMGRLDNEFQNQMGHFDSRFNKTLTQLKDYGRKSFQKLSAKSHSQDVAIHKGMLRAKDVLEGLIKDDRAVRQRLDSIKRNSKNWNEKDIVKAASWLNERVKTFTNAHKTYAKEINKKDKHLKWQFGKAASDEEVLNKDMNAQLEKEDKMLTDKFSRFGKRYLGQAKTAVTGTVQRIGKDVEKKAKVLNDVFQLDIKDLEGQEGIAKGMTAMNGAKKFNGCFARPDYDWRKTNKWLKVAPKLKAAADVVHECRRECTHLVGKTFRPGGSLIGLECPHGAPSRAPHEPQVTCWCMSNPAVPDFLRLAPEQCYGKATAQGSLKAGNEDCLGPYITVGSGVYLGGRNRIATFRV